MSAQLPSLLLVEDHAVLGQLMDRYLRDHAGLEVWGVAPTAEEALEKLAAASKAASGRRAPAPSPDGVPSADGDTAALPDLVLIDVSLPGMSGIELVGELSRLYPGLPCLMLSAHRNLIYVQQALDNGARGYVAKGYPAVVLEAVRSVLAGEIYLSDELRRALGR